MRRPDDFHVHLRSGGLLKQVAPASDAQMARALVMPNTDPPVLTAEDIVRYRAEIVECVQWLEPLMTIKIVPSTTPEIVHAAKKAGAIAGKVYPEGVTTNSADGASEMRELYPAFEAMQACGMVLSLHGESPKAFCLDRERVFLAELREIAQTFPRLKIVLEHITTQAAIIAVRELPDTVAATVTVHHLFLTLDDVIGGALHPHAFCKPIAKRPEDRDALVRIVMSGHPKFFLGTDSAPHPVTRKECANGCAGVYTAPVVMPILADLFDRMECLDALEGFTSVFGARHYGLPLNESSIALVQEPLRIPDQYDDIVPFQAGRMVAWRVE